MSNGFLETFKKKDAEHLITYKRYANIGVLLTISTSCLLGAMIAGEMQDASPGIPVSILAGLGLIGSFLFDFYLTPNKLKQWRNYREKMWDEGKLRYSIHEAPSSAPLFASLNFLGSISFLLSGFGAIIMASDNVSNNDIKLGIGAFAGSGVFLVLTFVSLFYFKSKLKRDTRSFIESKEASLLTSHTQNRGTAPSYGAVNQA